MNIFRQFRKNLSLCLVNLTGLSIMLACLLLSASYIKWELSYDRHHANADRVVRLSLQFGDEPVDGRIYGSIIDDILQQIPEIDRVVKMRESFMSTLTYKGNNFLVNEVYSVTSDFFRVFDIPLLQGDQNEALQRDDQILISESFARKLFAGSSFEEALTSEILIKGRSFFISGIFKDVPKNSHFQTDILLYRAYDWEAYTYTYLLLKSQTDIQALAQKITKLAQEKDSDQSSKPRAILMPLTDIHLHSHNLKEMSINGNINYIYLISGANMLLLIVVLFNLWLNGSLIFSYNRRYYQMLRLYGAPPSEVIKKEILSAVILGLLSIAVGVFIAYFVSSSGIIAGQISIIETVALCLMFLLSVVLVSLLPALKGISYTLFIDTSCDLKPIKFSYSNVKWMLTIQYAVVMIVLILAFGIGKQMGLVKDLQVGGNQQTMLVMDKLPEEVMAKYKLLKEELLKNVEIEKVTTAFQLPGDAVRDGINVRREGSMDWLRLPTMVAGEEFLSFFNIEMIAGRGFARAKYDYQTEEKMYLDFLESQNFSDHVEEYVINQKALAMLGFNTPDEAIGEILLIHHGMLDYFQQGVIVGVTNDFNYTGVYEETIPLFIMQRSMFQTCVMVQLAPNNFTKARATFDRVWNEVNPDYPANYIFMSDLFDKMYRNEMNAQQLVYIFSLLCFGLADLGLIVFMAFIIRRRTREISIRKIHGSSVGQIIGMLNMNFIRYIALAFVIAVPVAWYVMDRWLERFAYRTLLDWWLFVLVGLFVLLISFASVSLQSWRAARVNPVDGISKS